MIKAISFDLDGVYFINGKSNFIKNLAKLGVSEAEARRVFLESDEMFKIYKRGKMTDEEFWSWAIEEWKIKLSVKEVIELLIKGYEINQEVVKLVKKLRKNGYKTLICSNNFPARINGLQKRFKFLNSFDTAIFSYKVGATKPDIKIFKELVKQSGLKPEEILYSDDSVDKLVGAKKVGIQTFYYEGFDKFLSKLQEFGLKLN